jgi:ubiquinone/menaquinone biosynthesis C-methylase UbiE
MEQKRTLCIIILVLQKQGSFMINPKDIIEKFTLEELCQTADDYYKSISDPTVQMAKPFSSLIEGPEILKNMGLLLSGLRLGKTMTILDFAAGVCWFSRYLSQLHCKTISCDVSKTALEIGKRLFREHPNIGNPISEPSFLHFDGHKLDLPDESIDRIICFDSFHHVPNQEEVISELARVLKRGGIAGFSEPGIYHSQSPQSQYEMKNYKVLENDILIPEIFALARKHGFTDIRVKLFGDTEVSFNQYKLLTSQIVLKLLKIFSPKIWYRMTGKSIFFLFKGEYILDSRGPVGLSHSISLDKNVFSVKAGKDLDILIKVSNTGSARWLNENMNDIGVVRIGTHLYDEEKNLINLDFSRHDITSLTEPGATFEQTIKVKFNDVGAYKLAIDLVSENICWFEIVGSIPNLATINVE